MMLAGRESAVPVFSERIVTVFGSVALNAAVVPPV